MQAEDPDGPGRVIAMEQGAVTRILVVDHTPEMRKLLRMLALTDFDVIGLEATGADVLTAVEEGNPDVVVLDHETPGLGGITTARLIKGRRPGQAIMLYAAGLDDLLEDEAHMAGIALCVQTAEGFFVLERDLRRLAGEWS